MGKRYANGAHLSTIRGNTALAQWIRCGPSGEHLYIEHVLYFHTSHENDQRLYFLTRSSHTWHSTTINCVQSIARVRYGLIPIYVSQWKSQHRVWEYYSRHLFSRGQLSDNVELITLILIESPSTVYHRAYPVAIPSWEQYRKHS